MKRKPITLVVRPEVRDRISAALREQAAACEQGSKDRWNEHVRRSWERWRREMFGE